MKYVLWMTSLSFVFFAKSQSAAQVVDPDKAKFNMMWIEPLNLKYVAGSNVVNNFNLGITRPELATILQKYYDMGIRDLVIGYTARWGYFFFDPGPVGLAGQSYKDRNLDGSSKLISYAETWRRNNSLVHSNGVAHDFLTALLEECNVPGRKMNVYLGVGPLDDDHLVDAIHAKHQDPNYTGEVDVPKINYVTRLNNGINFSKQTVDRIWSMHSGKAALKGFYLTQELHCVEEAMDFYGPVAKHIKSKSSSLKVLISPPINAGRMVSCKTTKTYPQLLTAISPSIDMILYQDSIGAGVRTINGISHAVYGGDQFRAEQVIDNITYFNELIAFHAGKSVELAFNIEAWRHENYQSKPETAPWANLKNQLVAYKNLLPNAKFMFNEGLLGFDFGIANAKLVEPVAAAKAVTFTADYVSYLQPGLSQSFCQFQRSFIKGTWFNDGIATGAVASYYTPISSAWNSAVTNCADQAHVYGNNKCFSQGADYATVYATVFMSKSGGGSKSQLYTFTYNCKNISSYLGISPSPVNENW
jgi:hypothetical protein